MISRLFAWNFWDGREDGMADLQLAHDQLGELREEDLPEADLLLTHLASRIREGQATRMPKRDRSPPSSPPQLLPLKTPRGGRPTSPPTDQDNPEIEGPEGEELEDKREIPGGGGSDPGDDNLPSSENGSSTPPSSPPGSPGGSPGGGSPGGGSPLQLNPPLFPAEASVPLHSTIKIFTAAETTAWDPAIVGSIPMIAMIQSTLTKRLPIPPGFLFPARTPFVRATYTQDRLPFRADHRRKRVGPDGYGANRPTPLSFDHNLHRRGNSSLWRIAVSYAGLEEDYLIAYWESAHYLEITKAMLTSDPDLFIYHQD
ncbi:hypothetical protein PHMEG_00011902 [Phytophthora megakarya]|uniref:Uncharacterized protein n=1 Tax=Phytophthora megakarya TaxID=4795 RepID=A0A225WA36_9STRA|nr:hypothetical protein PHMEG_00011902 [Phytophthora megakarya]